MKIFVIFLSLLFLYGCQRDKSLNLSKEEIFSEVEIAGQNIFSYTSTEESLKVEKRYRRLIKKIHKDKLLVGVNISETQKIFSDWEKCDPKLHRSENGEVCTMLVPFFYNSEVLKIFADDEGIIKYTQHMGA